MTPFTQEGKEPGPVHKSHEPENRDLEQKATVDTLHADEGSRILATYTGDREWTLEEEKKLVRKIDVRLLTLLTLSYGLQYYDKALLGKAAIFGFREDAGLDTGNRYSFAAAIFYIGFLIGAVPASPLAQRYPVDRVVSGIVLVWGGCLMAAAGCKSFQAVYIQRFFLGFLESGVSPIFMLSVGSFYKKKEQALRQGIWYSATGFVSIFSPLINYGLGHITSGPLRSWQYMFLLAGGLTVLWAFILLFFFPSDPTRVRGMGERERFIAISRLQSNNAGIRNTHFKKEQVYELLLDIKFWLIFSMSFLNMIPNGPGSSFIPIIIKGFGFSQLNTMLLNMPYGVVAGIVNILLPWVAYRYKNMRCLVIAFGYTMAVISSALLWKLPRDGKGALLFACYIFPFWGGSFGTTMGLATANNAGYTKRSVASSGLFLGYCLGNIVAPMLFQEKDSPAFSPGFTAVVICMCAAIMLTLIYRQYCIWENSKRDRSGTVEAFDHAFDDDVTDKKNMQFRYVY